MRLFLDDERIAPPGWIQTYTAANAIRLLKSGAVKEISLDHDLGPAEAGTGYDVACWIEKAACLGELSRLKWSVHSANPVGIQKMTAALMQADRYWHKRSNIVPIVLHQTELDPNKRYQNR